jgi:hypothetical protein
MKILWCWRCQMEVPMLEEGEAKIAYESLNAGFKNEFGSTLRERFSALIEYYKEVTGEEYTNPNAIMHHIVDAYGPPCEKCGKPYRTSEATFCAACGNRRVQ